MRLILLLIAVLMICGAPANAQSADHNAGLKVVGNVYAWSVKSGRVSGLPDWPETKFYRARVEFIVSNEGSETIICPGLLSHWSDIRFVDGSAAESAAIVKSRDLWGESNPRAAFWEEPRTDKFRILDPGDSFRIETFVEIVIRPDRSRSAGQESWGIFIEDREPARRLLSRSHLKFVFRMISDKKEPDTLRTVALRWKKIGKLPLNDAGEFFIETPAFESNSYWIKPEELP